ncbi:MAG: MATE family efflux transporter [Ruminococcus sp.]|nr:MATE family efflux transporter [Ruminococcus sp.]
MKDLTQGRPMKLILLFAIPLLLGNLFQQLYNLADTRIVGEFLGEQSLAAVGATSSINNVIIGFLNGLTNGFALLTARYFGAKDKDKVKETVAATLVMGFITAAVLTVASLLLLDPLLHAINVDETIFDNAKGYISVIIAGMSVSMCYNIAAALMRAVGDTVMPLIFLVVSAVVNVGLDLLFIGALGMGVQGAAYATLISQGISVLLCIYYMFTRHRELLPERRHFRFSRSLACNMYLQGTSMGLMISLVGIGSLILQGAINSFGAETIVSHTASRKISEMFMLPFLVFGAAAATFSGQNFGAGKYSRVRKGFIDATLLGWIWSVITIAVCYPLTPLFVRLITGSDSQFIAELSNEYIRFNTPFYFVLSIVIVFRNALQGVGAKLFPLISSLIELTGKLIVASMLAPRIGYTGVKISEPLVWIAMTFLLGAGFITNKDIRRRDETPEPKAAVRAKLSESC